VMVFFNFSSKSEKCGGELLNFHERKKIMEMATIAFKKESLKRKLIQ